MTPAEKGEVKTILFMFMSMYPLSYIWRSPAMKDLSRRIGWILETDAYGVTVFDAITGVELENTFDE